MYARTLGIAPALVPIIVADAPKILSAIEGLFAGSSYDATHQAILTYVRMILADPAGATSGNYTPIPQTGGLGWHYSAANALVGLRCWAGDQSVLPLAKQLDPPTQANSFYQYTNGCGCEVDHGCRADAQSALQQVMAALNQPVPVVSSAPIPSGYTGPSTSPSTGTVYTTLPGGISVGLPVPVSTLTGATILGVPIAVWAVGLGVLAFSGGRRGRA